MTKLRTVSARLWSRVKVGMPDECWPWLGYKTPLGYGRMGVDGKVVYVSRVVYELTHGPIPEGNYICHRCDFPPCVNPAHLFAGTQGDNVRDSVAKGRAHRAEGDANGRHTHPEATSRGDDHWTRKRLGEPRGSKAPNKTAPWNRRFTAEQAQEIQARYAAGGTSLPKLAREYGVGTSTIHRVVKGTYARRAPD